ncbi:MAG: sugar transferase [Acidimicrobiia bacterium]|nr:sugar transferase [Acidimicrobiia bacterium]
MAVTTGREPLPAGKADGDLGAEEDGDSVAMTDALGERQAVERGQDSEEQLAGSTVPTPTSPGRARDSAPAGVTPISARLRQVHAAQVPSLRTGRRSRRPTARDAVRGVLNWVARLSPTARLATDVIALFIAFSLVIQIRLHLPHVPIRLSVIPLEYLFLVYLPVLAVLRLYAPSHGVHLGSLVSELPKLVAASVVTAALIAGLLGQRLDLGRAAFTAAFTLLCLVLARSGLHVIASLLRRRGYGVRKTLIVGRGKSVPSLASKLARHPEIGLRVVGVITPDASDTAGDETAGPATIAGHPEDLPEIVTRLDIEQLILVPEDADTQFVADCFMAVDGFRVHASLVPPLQDFLLSPSNVEQIEGIPLISLGRLSYAPRMMPGKRAFDLIGAVAALVLFSPVLLLLAAAIKFEDRGPVLFRQKRAGYRGRYFRMIKFRSMCVDAESKLADLADKNESDGLLFKMKDDPRITRVGAFIRRTSLDELPQFLNVLTGDMSLVGPRALPVEVEHFGDIAIKRLNVRPGVTGYWQVLGRSDLTYDEMVKLDLAYIQNWSIWADIQLILKTLPVIFGRKGAY